MEIVRRFQHTFTLLAVLDMLRCTDGRQGVTYYPSTYKVIWASASTDCQHIGGSLAKITSVEENNQIVNFMLKWDETMMMVGGVEDNTGSPLWRWEDSSIIDITIPTSHDISSPSADKLTVTSDGNWKDIVDDQNEGFVCEIVKASSEAQVAAVVRACRVANGLFVPPPGTEMMACPRGKLYFTPESIRALEPWSDAQSVCQAAGGDLARITTEEEHNIITRLRSSYDNMGNAWIGGTDSDGDGVYTWADGAAFTWPSSYAGPAPTVTGQCLVLSSTDEWGVETCTLSKRFICERDISLSRRYGDVCFWTIGNDIWTTLQDTCQTVGGTLAKVDNAEEWQMVINSFSGDDTYYLGSQDPESDNRFAWSDGTIITWSYWNNIEPNYAFENCIIAYSDGGWNDKYCNFEFKGICEKTVSSAVVIMNASKIIEDDKVVYRCDEGHFFDDYTTEKTYTCSSVGTFQDFVNTLTDLDCNPIKVTVMEARYVDYPTTGYNVLFDGNDGTCLNLNDYWIYLPMTTIRMIISGHVTVTLTVGTNIQMLAQETTKVFVSRSGVYTADYYSQIELYNKCDSLPNLSFACQCTGACSLYIRFRFRSMAAAQGIVYTVCGISIA